MGPGNAESLPTIPSKVLTTRFNSFQVSRRRDWTNFIAAFDEKYFVSDF